MMKESVRERKDVGIVLVIYFSTLLNCRNVLHVVLVELCRHKAAKDLKDEILKRHVNLRDMSSGLVPPNPIF